MSFLYWMPTALIQIALDGHIKMMTPQAAGLLAPLAASSNFDNLFSVLTTVAPQIQQRINGFNLPHGVVCDKLHISVAAGIMSRYSLELEVRIHRTGVDTVMVVFTDVTALKQAEKELSHRAAILDGLPAHICVINTQGIIVTTNQAWNSFARENSESAESCGVGANYLAVCLAGEGDERQSSGSYVNGLRGVLDGSLSEFSLEYPCHSPTEERWFICHVNPFNVAGEVFAVIAHENITWRKNSEKILKKLSQAIAQNPASIIITDALGTIEFVNQSFTTTTGYAAEEAIGRNWSFLQSDKNPPQMFSDMVSTIISGGVWQGDLRCDRKDGVTFWIHRIVSPIYDDQGSIVNFISAAEDITEKKSLTDQLIHAQRAESIGQLAGGLAHELNNILSVISGYASLLEIEELKPHQLKNIAHIMTAIQAAKNVTYGMVAYGRKLSIRREEIDLSALITTACSFISQFLRKDILISVSLPDTPIIMGIDPIQMRQVLTHLATNAQDAMPDGGSLLVSAEIVNSDSVSSAIPHYVKRRDVEYVIISVKDSGHGMDEDTRRRIFDPFYTTREVGKGTGLGLAIVFGIISQHGGTIDVQSELGVGTVFRLFLPTSFVEESVDTSMIEAITGGSFH